MQAPQSMVMLSTVILVALGGCDTREGVDAANAEPEVAADVLDINWDAVPPPSAIASALAVDIELEPAIPTAGPGGWQFEIETFWFHSSDIFALTTAADSLFAPVPANIALFEADELASGQFVGFEFRDDNDVIIGFGSEQLDIDFQELEAQPTYTFTVPGRGALVIAQREDIGYVIDEVNDMVANDEYVRVYDPPWVTESTIPGTGKVIGGTGEFAGAKGVAREFVVIYKLDLLTGMHEFTDVIQVALLPGMDNG
jgi:hypothetical protein